MNIQEMFADDPLNSALAAAMDGAVSRGPSPVWPELSAAVYTAEQEIFTGQKDIPTALADAQATIDGLGME